MKRSSLIRAGIAFSYATAVLSAAGLLSTTESLGNVVKGIPFKNWGLYNFQSKSHIDAVDAWKIQKGSRKIVVAVIDTGIDPSHPALKGNIWNDPVATKTKPVYGWNFVVNQANPADLHGHGTHVAGIIGAAVDQKKGVAGVANEVSIMSVKYYSDANTGLVNLANTVKALNYAIDHGARIINYSGGGPEFAEEEYLAIRRAESKGILLVAAAGNEHQDTDKVANYYYPQSYHLSNIISVAATDINNNLLKSSNWGKKRVDVAAPGENIYSTLPGGNYGYMTGTSQATAFVTGVAALLLSQDPSLTPSQIRQLITASADKIPQLKEKVSSGGRVNAYAALKALQAQKKMPGNRDNLILARQQAQ
ncbi:S8 family serine peptidase [bacterium]|jgi:subtilisin family serine protease|nr:S8 family serine peptidase [bacterium]